MILCSLLQSVEFYVVLTVVAAAVVGFCARDTGCVGPVQTLFFEGELLRAVETTDSRPEVEVMVSESGQTVTIVRRGLEGVADDGIICLVATVKGFDVELRERRFEGSVISGTQCAEAVFRLDFMGSERYHVRYCGGEDANAPFAAFTLAVRPGLKLRRPLRR